MEVRDLMTTDVVAVGPTASIRDAARLMFRYRVSGLPVVDVEDHVLGIVTEGDFLQMEIERLESGNVPEQVGSVMSKSVKTIPPDMDIIGAARFMKDQDVKRLVVAEDGKMVGIISRFDIVAAFTRPDDLIEDEIKEDLLRRVLFVDPETVEVAVSNGVVTLVGSIGTRNEARLVEELARRLDGVVDVANRLTWRIDDTDQTAPGGKSS
ncbi:MAG: CBS domain-containing protein [Actinomycetota bacterium]|jgi:CBS domain-containing protein|nr:CBS domain-containing protein [Actinomycetota bacterium]